MSSTINTTETSLTDPQAYASPQKFCDIVMKGGITSGVAYPLAVCELARSYSLKNIGGASAGAIAAAAAAAAEYSRRTGRQRADGSSGYVGLSKLPAWLGSEGNLARLFQPNPSTKPIFNLLTRSLEITGGGFIKFVYLLPTAWRNFPLWTLGGIIFSLLLALPLIAGSLLLASSVDSPAAPTERLARQLLFGYGSLFTFALVILITSVFVIVGIVLRIRSSIPENFYGLTTGLLDPKGRDDASPALTTWLADEIDRLAGKPHRSEPLTFGDLRNTANDLDREHLPEEKEGWGINLQMMTTNLTLGRPYRLPFDGDSTEYFYDPTEWSRFFPAYIMKWLEDHPRELTETEPTRRDRQAAEWKSFAPRKPLPKPKDIPIVIAARMSLSFPILISAVPLWTVDRSRMRKKDEKTGTKRPTQLERCFFSDGGISSNFPIHFFDQALPRWVTFGIDLQNFHPDYKFDPNNPTPDQSKGSYLIHRPQDGLADLWDRFDAQTSDLARLTGFFGALVNTMYNWADNAQVRVPGYRDRVIHIYQSETEGGMNLNMKPEAIQALSERGRFAGVKLRERFMGDDGSTLTWDNHRWIRYRSLMSLLENTLRDLQRAYKTPLFGDQPYSAMIARSPDDPPVGYRLEEPGQREFVAHATDQLIALINEWEKDQNTTGQNFVKGEPNPKPELRVRPRI